MPTSGLEGRGKGLIWDLQDVSIFLSTVLVRTELLKLLLTCFSDAMYLPPSAENNILNRWVTFFSSTDNR